MKYVRDHLGNEFNSIVQMCDFHKISAEVYYSRVRRKWSLEMALTTPVGGKAGYRCKDHEGHVFKSVQAMCDHYGVGHTLYYWRRRKGMTVRQALTSKIQYKKNGIKVDHTGKRYDSFTDMCRAYNMNYHTVTSRLVRGKDLSEALTKPSQKKKK